MDVVVHHVAVLAFVDLDNRVADAGKFAVGDDQVFHIVGLDAGAD